MAYRSFSRVLAASAFAFTIASATTAFAVEQQIEHASVSLPAPTQNLDPAKSVSATDRAIYALTNGTLMRATTTGEIVPGLAESITYNDDFTSATVKLHSGLKFSDGSPLTADDVVGTFNRHMAVEGSVLGAFFGRIESATATDETTVEVKFKGPFPSFSDFSSAGGYGIYPASKITEENFFANPVTSGPYKIAQNWASNKIELTENENYAGGKPAIKNITYQVVDDANSAISQLQTGQLDYIGDLPPNFVTPLQGMDGVTVSSIPTYGFYDIRLWNRDGPFANVDMRKAVAAALDRDTIVRSIWGESNKAMSGFWPPVMAGHEDKPTGADLDAAKEYLSKTDCADGCEIRMMYSDQDFPFSSQLALIVQNQLSKVGITVKLERLDTPTLVKRLFGGDYDMVPGAMAAAANIPDHLLGNALVSNGFLKAEFSGYQSEEMDGLIQKVNSTSGEARAEALAGVEALFTKDQPYVTYAPWVRVTASRLPEDAISLVGTQIAVGSVDE